MTDKSPATQAVKVTDWEAYAAERHADKLRQVRQRLTTRLDILREFHGDGQLMADEIARLRQELAGQGVVV